MLRINEQMWSALIEQLLRRSDVETAAIIFADAVGAGREVLAAREVVLLPDEAYSVRTIDRIQIHPVALNRLIRPARDRGMSIVTVHSHPLAREAWFSQADDRGDARLLPSFCIQAPGTPHGAIVIAGSGDAVGRFMVNARCEPMPLRVVGREVQSIGDAVAEVWDGRFARQVLALGAPGQRKLRRLRIAVVGLGGIGSVVAAQLMHLGVGHLVLMDGDRVEVSNLSRVFGVREADIGQFKTEVARRYGSELGTPTVVQTHERHLTSRDDLDLLLTCDIIICAVDRHTPRALLNRGAYDAIVPVIDLGTAFRVDATGGMTGAAGRVVVIGPGRPCLSCWGHIDPEALRREALTALDRRAELAAGYIDGADVPQPSVIPFNTMVAGAGVIELLRLATKFAGGTDPPQRLALRFDEGDVRRNRLAGEPACSVCGVGRGVSNRDAAA